MRHPEHLVDLEVIEFLIEFSDSRHGIRVWIPDGESVVDDGHNTVMDETQKLTEDYPKSRLDGWEHMEDQLTRLC